MRAPCCPLPFCPSCLEKEATAAALDIDAATELELSTDGDVLVVTPVRDRKRRDRVAEIVSEAHEQYGGVFRRLAE